MNDLILNNTNITEWEGLYRAHDIYTAQGSPLNQQVGQWMRLPETQRFMQELSGIIPLNKKRRGGSLRGVYLHKYAALEYARYLDPKLAIVMNKVFDDFVNGRLQKLDDVSSKLKEINVSECLMVSQIAEDYGRKPSTVRSVAVRNGLIMKKGKRYTSLSPHVIVSKSGTCFFDADAIDIILTNRVMTKHLEELGLIF